MSKESDAVDDPSYREKQKVGTYTIQRRNPRTKIVFTNNCMGVLPWHNSLLDPEWR